MDFVPLIIWLCRVILGLLLPILVYLLVLFIHHAVQFQREQYRILRAWLGGTVHRKE